MKRTVAIVLWLALAGWGCQPKSSPQLLAQFQGRSLYTCCNIHYEHDEINDANYFVGATLPFGSPATVEAISDSSVTFRSGATKLTLFHSYGRDQESNQQYVSKILVEADPHTAFDTYPPKIREAIADGRVEKGMTRDQVLMSLGYPPTHRTASIEAPTWTYWYNRWVTYTVSFGSDGKVTAIAGSNAPTRNEDLSVAPTPVPKAKAAPKKRK